MMTAAINPGVYMEQRRKQILCLCNDSNMLQVRRMLLEHFGYSVVPTSSVDNVKALVKESCPDMLLMDNNDSEIDFDNLAKQVKGMCPEVITVMLSPYYYGSRDGSDAIDCVVAKDDGPRVLLSQIEELLGKEENKLAGRASRPM
jgi:CheY-like chemotaxis protein